MYLEKLLRPAHSSEMNETKKLTSESKKKSNSFSSLSWDCISVPCALFSMRRRKIFEKMSEGKLWEKVGKLWERKNTQGKFYWGAHCDRNSLLNATVLSQFYLMIFMCFQHQEKNRCFTLPLKDKSQILFLQKSSLYIVNERCMMKSLRQIKVF